MCGSQGRYTTCAWLVWFYSDSVLDITSKIEHVLQHAYTQGEFTMSAILGIGENGNGDGIDVKVEWIGFEEDKST